MGPARELFSTAFSPPANIIFCCWARFSALYSCPISRVAEIDLPHTSRPWVKAFSHLPSAIAQEELRVNLCLTNPWDRRGAQRSEELSADDTTGPFHEQRSPRNLSSRAGGRAGMRGISRSHSPLLVAARRQVYPAAAPTSSGAVTSGDPSHAHTTARSG